MEKIICVCNTYYQLLVLLQMKMTVFRKDSVTLLLSDHSTDASVISDRLSKSNIFDKVIFIKTKDSLDFVHGSIRNVFISARTAFGKFSFYRHLLNAPLYDKFLFFSFNVSSNLLFNILSARNPDIECARFEEGLLSYNLSIPSCNMENKGKMRLIHYLRKIFFGFDLKSSVKKFYCMFPEFYCPRIPTSQIPYSEETILKGRDILSNIFQIDRVSLSYPQKYIFFSCTGDFEGDEPLGEYALVETIAGIVGKENLLIKKHPRDTRNLYEKNGFHVDNASSVPWEVIELNYDFSHHIFLSAVSSTGLLNCMIQEKTPPILFLYPLCKNRGKNQIMENSIHSLEILLKQDEKTNYFNKVKIIKNWDSFSDFIKKAESI